MSILGKKIANNQPLTEEQLARYKARALVLSDEIKFLSNKPNKTKSDINQIFIKGKEFAFIYKKLKKARKEALNNDK